MLKPKQGKKKIPTKTPKVLYKLLWDYTDHQMDSTIIKSIHLIAGTYSYHLEVCLAQNLQLVIQVELYYKE